MKIKITFYLTNDANLHTEHFINICTYVCSMMHTPFILFTKKDVYFLLLLIKPPLMMGSKTCGELKQYT